MSRNLSLDTESQWQSVWTFRHSVWVLAASDLHSVEGWPQVAGRLQGERVTMRWAGPSSQRLEPGLWAEGWRHGCRCFRQEACWGTLGAGPCLEGLPRAGDSLLVRVPQRNSTEPTGDRSSCRSMMRWGCRAMRSVGCKLELQESQWFIQS